MPTRESEPAYQLEVMVDKYTLAKVVDMLAGICGAKADHIQENWQDAPLSRRWQSVSNSFARQAETLRRKRL